MTRMAQRVQGFGTTIFAEMTALANRHHAVNLGQGFPDFAAPAFIKEAARESIARDINQYAPGIGQPRLRRAIAAKMERHYGLGVDPDAEVTVTVGATEAIFAAIMGLVDPGDEVIFFEPYYDSYLPSLQFAGGAPRFYTLQPPEWTIDIQALAALFNEKTKLIVVNTPHNPTGKVYSREELELIARLCQEHDVIALVDEVYEHVTFDGGQHHSLITFPGMRERTLSISSAGKTFSVTGWKVGWAVGAPELARAVFRAHQFITYSGAAPLQEATARAIEVADERGYYEELGAMYQQRRNYLLDALQNAGLRPIRPRGTYFVMVDISDLGFEDDVAFCRHLTTEVGVAAIPPSAFYTTPGGGQTLARFAFCKTEAALEEAARRLRRWHGG
ncbi:MAG TPA: methionine aminotransferase [Candidatus Sulfomarinibacteraceae bacterium]|nr:methionine aminotransferase [Candidatus Sulfomarinibacteraceae bacterium]